VVVVVGACVEVVVGAGGVVVDVGETSAVTVVSVDDVSPTLVVVGTTVVDVVATIVAETEAVVVGATAAVVVGDAARLVVAVRIGEGASVTCPRTLPTAAEAISTEIAVTVTQATMSPTLLFTRPSCPSRWV
jgi:hypothetical protein